MRQSRLQRKVELVDGLEEGKVGVSGAALETRLFPSRDFFGQQESEEVTIRPGFLLRPIRDLQIDPAHVRQIQTPEVGLELSLGKFRTLQAGWGRSASSSIPLADLSRLFPSSRRHLLQDERALEEALHVRGTEDLLLKPFLQGSTQNLGAMVLQDLVEPIHVAHPLLGPAMDDLGRLPDTPEFSESRMSEFPEPA